MLALTNDKAHPHYAHPMFWAPFVVVERQGNKWPLRAEV
jgi:CHAT domain-containing protein